MEIKTLKSRPTLAVRTVCPASGLPEMMGRVYGEIAGYMAQAGVDFAGPPYALYRNMDMEALDVEVGFPVGRAAGGTERIRPSELPAGQAATAVHLGPYSDIEKTYNLLQAFVKEKGVKPLSWMYESYLNSPEDTPPEKLATEIVFPLED